ncbi:hypothetical protein HPB50_007382 [Hyalomma asiaticum]|uniref:Uncharacterized protein n=1 Tax=Hyalomma asiaticum TaxID=266040 RepID=A0ACB7SZX4_HYAAI|nr:hypothetical protein HPB50_007382 [Hyalomma asiaticum]
MLRTKKPEKTRRRTREKKNYADGSFACVLGIPEQGLPFRLLTSRALLTRLAAASTVPQENAAGLATTNLTFLQIVLVCLVAGAYAVNGYGRPDLSDLDDFDGPSTTPAAPTGTASPATSSTPTSTAGPTSSVSPARPAVTFGTTRRLRPVNRPAAVPIAPATRPAIFAPGAAGLFPSGLPGEEWKPYSFGYDTTDEFGTRLFHNEQSDNKNAKTGTYGYRDVNGIFRTVTYVADADGFRATIDTNEPGTAPGASADAVFNANPVPAPPTTPRPGGSVRPTYTRPSYTRPSWQGYVRSPVGYTGGYTGGYSGGFGGTYAGGYGGRYGSAYGGGYRGGFGGPYDGYGGAHHGGSFGYNGGYTSSAAFPGGLQGHHGHHGFLGHHSYGASYKAASA